MIDKRVEDWCVQAMTVQELKPRGSAEAQQQSSADILSPHVLENEKESSQTYRVNQHDSENLLGRVLAGKFQFQQSLREKKKFYFFFKEGSFLEKDSNLRIKNCKSVYVHMNDI